MIIRYALVLTALALALSLQATEPARAQPAIVCPQMANQMTGRETVEDLREVRRRAVTQHCEALMRDLDARIARMESRSEETGPDCDQPNALAASIVASNNETAIRRFHESTDRACTRARQLAIDWLNRGDRPLTQLHFFDRLTPRLTEANGEEGFFYHQYEVRLGAGAGARISVHSENVVSVVAVGNGRMPDNYDTLDATDVVNEGGGLVLEFEAPGNAGEVSSYVVVVGARDRARLGAYTLAMDQYNPPGPRAITLNQPVPGELTTRTYDLWSFSGNAGDRIRMFLSSDAFDSYLLFGRMVNGVFTPIETDDDGGGNLNSLIVYRLEEAGEYVVRAQSLGGRSHGAYQLSVSTYLPASATPVRIRDEGNATVIVDALSESSPADEEFNFYQDYEFRARNGRAYVAHVYSTEFSPILELGQLQRAAVNPVDFYTDESERERGRVEFTANNDGLYVLRVRASGSRPGEFQLMITEAPRE